MDRHAQWDASPRGLTPLETAMNVAMPEFDGRIISVPISFKEARPGDARLDGPVVSYVPRRDRVERVVGRRCGWRRCAASRTRDKRVALVLTNYNAKASRIGNAVGLDTPASLLRLLHAMRAAGYDVGDPAALPADGDALLAELIDRCSYDTELLTEAQLAHAAARVPAAQYAAWFDALPATQSAPDARRAGDRRRARATSTTTTSRWPGSSSATCSSRSSRRAATAWTPTRSTTSPTCRRRTTTTRCTAGCATVSGPTRWSTSASTARSNGCRARASASRQTCYPDLFLADLPLIYPFIINDPGEGAQAKRRAHAVIVDHLTPPMTTADAYGELDELSSWWTSTTRSRCSTRPSCRCCSSRSGTWWSTHGWTPTST